MNDRCAGSGRILRGLLLAAAWVLAALPAAPQEVCAQDVSPGAAVPVGSGPISEAKARVMSGFLSGEWAGARLLCRKEEDNAVRCGKPVSFSVVFDENGKGTSTDEHFPNTFTYRWKSESELVLTSAGGNELTLFQLEIKEGFLTFQTYIYLAIKDPSLPKESSYIHYIFDVHRID